MWTPTATSTISGSFSPTGIPASPHDDPAHGNAEASWSAGLNSVGGLHNVSAHRDDPMDTCRRALSSAQHLSPATRAAALEMLSRLATDRRVQVPDGDDTRKQAVAGIQWAMETTLRGTEVIMTPERATPLRTIGDPQRPEAQRVRADALQARFHRGDPLHLVFCRDGTGTPAEDATYRREVLTPAREAHLPLEEHVLPMPRARFPAALSGAVIVSAHEAEPVAFAFRAAQADKIGSTPCLTLWWIAPGAGSGQEVLAEWGQFLDEQTCRPLGRLLDRFLNAAAP